MADLTESLLAEILTFLAKTGMGPSYFGVLACGNCKVVERLKAGRSMEVRTVERVKRFIATY